MVNNVPQNLPKIAIGVATFKRPKLLTALLESLQSLKTDGMDVQLVIGDNDAEGSARDIVAGWESELPFPVIYLVESTRGISSVRNRIVAEAKAQGAEFIAFVDDDATAHQDWLKLLVDQITKSNSAGVAGPAIYGAEDHDVPQYIKHCFPYPTRPTGEYVERAGSGNVILRIAVLDNFPGPFDTNLDLIGGADSLLSAQIIASGYTISWCQEAIVHEHIHPERANIKWILRRQFRTGASQSQITKSTRPGILNLGKNVTHAFGVIGMGILRLLRAAFVERDRLLQWMAMVTFGAGELAGVFTAKATLSQYRKVEGN